MTLKKKKMHFHNKRNDLRDWGVMGRHLVRQNIQYRVWSILFCHPLILPDTAAFRSGCDVIYSVLRTALRRDALCLLTFIYLFRFSWFGCFFLDFCASTTSPLVCVPYNGGYLVKSSLFCLFWCDQSVVCVLCSVWKCSIPLYTRRSCELMHFE